MKFVFFKHETRISPKQHETRVLQTCISMLKSEVRVLIPKCETRVQSVPECDSHVPTTQHIVRVLKKTLPKRDAQTRISLQKCKTRVQPQMAKIKANPKSSHL